MVYVDKLTACTPVKKWKYKTSCHLWADTLEELFEFIDEKMPAWFNKKWLHRSVLIKDKIFFDHFDLTRSNRLIAVQGGAQEVDTKFLIEFCKNKRRKK